MSEPGSVPLGLVRVEIEPSALPWAETLDPELLRKRARYVAGIEHIAAFFDAAQPLVWEGDAVTFVLGGRPAESLPEATFEAAREVWTRMQIEMALPARVAADVMLAQGSTGKEKEEHLRALCALAGAGRVAFGEDLVLALPESMRGEVRELGPAQGGLVYAFPAGASTEGVRDPWGALRQYAQSPEVRLLRYVGFRLHERQPPRLDVRDVFVPSTIELTERRIREPGDLERERRELGALEEGAKATRSISLREALAAQRSLVVLGEPGAGKTTLLRWLAVLAAGGRFVLASQFGLSERLLPVLASVGRLAEVRRSFPGDPAVSVVLARHFHERVGGDEGALHQLLVDELTAGRCLVLLDGLDEVVSGERETVDRWLEAFAATYPKNRFIVSSRLVGYAGLTLPGGAEVTLRPFDDEQIERYLRGLARAWTRWEAGSEVVGEAEHEAEKLLSAIRASGRLSALAKNPFMLSSLALIHRAEGKLPRHRVQAYQIFARALCETWADARRITAGEGADPTIPYDEEALPILGELAIAMHERYPAGVAPEDFVVETLRKALGEQKGVAGEEAARAAREFLRKAGEDVQILIERGAGQWGFLHLTFQEFFTAAGLHAAERFEEVALAHLFDPRWEEVIRLGVGYMALVQQRPAAARRFVERVLAWEEPEPRRWLTSTLQKQIPLAALCAAEAGDALPVPLQEKR